MQKELLTAINSAWNITGLELRHGVGTEQLEYPFCIMNIVSTDISYNYCGNVYNVLVQFSVHTKDSNGAESPDGVAMGFVDDIRKLFDRVDLTLTGDYEHFGTKVGNIFSFRNADIEQWIEWSSAIELVFHVKDK